MSTASMSSIQQISENGTGPGDGMSRLEIARHLYTTRGWTVIPVEPLQKDPGYSKWQQVRYESVDDVDEKFAKHEWEHPNLGVLLGEPSSGLADVDLDIPGAVRLAPVFLPATNLTSGRVSISAPQHYFYSGIDPLPPTKKFALPIKGQGADKVDQTMVLEIRTNQHTVIPPSGYEGGDQRRWFAHGEPLEIEGQKLRQTVGELAAAAGLAYLWPSQGSRHEAALALAGGLILGGWSEEKAFWFLGHVCDAAGEDWKEIKEDRLKAIRTTMAKRNEGERVTNWGTLAKLLINGESVVRTIIDWLGLDWATSLNPREEAMLTDVGNALLFERKYGDGLKFTPSHGWAHWSGMHWDFKRGDQVAKQRAMQLGDDIFEVASAATDYRIRERTEKHAKASMSQRAIEAATTLASSLPLIWRQRDEFDNQSTTRGFLNTPDGVVNLRTGKVEPHDRSQLMSLITRGGVGSYVPGRQVVLSKEFEGALNLMTQGDDELEELLQLLAGYTLSGGNPSDYIIVIRGEGGTGKTTFMGALANVLGDYAASPSANVFFQRTNTNGPTPEIARLVGKRGIFIDEVARRGMWDEAALKQMSGHTPFSARHLHRDTFEFLLDGPPWIVANQDPKFSPDDSGMWRRVKFLWLPEPPKGLVVDEGIRERLHNPMTPDPSVLAWAVEGARKWFEMGRIVFPQKVVKDTEDLRERLDSITELIDDCLIRDPEGRIQAADMLGMYNSWARTRNYPPLNQRNLGDKMAAKKFEKGRVGSYIYYFGLRMRPDARVRIT